MDNISVIIRNRNESEHIGYAIQSCLDYFNNPEIIIMDNNSTDDSLQIISLFRPILKNKLKIININNYSPGASLNKGVKEATNNIILVLSAHAQIIDLNINQVLEDLKESVAVFGKQKPIYKGKKITPRYIWSHFTNDRIINMYSKIEDRYFLHNAFCFYKKQTLVNNPFDETLQGKEDRYWAINMVSKGHNYLYNPNLSVNHYYTQNGATWKGIG
tara:strand:+ start:1567 stop:2214 length:648 start_codon:yes stop_codon:yes gene_type:complete